MTQSADESRHIHRVGQKKLENRQLRASVGAIESPCDVAPRSGDRAPEAGEPAARPRVGALWRSDAEADDNLVAVPHRVVLPLDVLQPGRLHFALRAEPQEIVNR